MKYSSGTKPFFSVILLAFVLCITITILGCQPAGGPVRKNDEWANMEADLTFHRGEAYYQKANYEAALIQYRKYLDEYAELHRADDVAFRIAQSLEASGERIEAADAYRALAMMYSRSGLAPSAHLRAGELYELEGWLKDARWDYRKSAKYRFTDAGKLAHQRAIAVDKILDPDKYGMSAQIIREDSSETEPAREYPKSSYDREFPPKGRPLINVLLGR
ncbi:MAG: hypothetical protein JKX97_00765 [Candidatus Lindowbacteria bacterium]|nr:hypothetical protein [Candidatus Lindowbacteria bacterium]